jgi:peroxiredoxin family protein/TusA-related sulfurtransferase
VYCKVGFRSYLAYRILAQKGVDVKNLSGGVMTFCSYHGSGICQMGEPEPPMLSYAEEKIEAAATPSGRTVEVDATGLQCPGPLMRLKDTMDGLSPGDELAIRASDPGFLADAPAWCKRNRHEVVDIGQEGGVITARIRKAGAAAVATSPASRGVEKTKKTLVVFSGDLDRVMASFVIANGAAAMGSEVSMFFTFWGLNALRKRGPQAPGKGFMDRMFGWMMPKGPDAMKLSKMNMAGMGTAMMKSVMRKKNVQSLPDLMQSARQAGVRLIACTMTMEVMGLKKEELIDGVEFGGVAAFLGEADDSSATLFV